MESYAILISLFLFEFTAGQKFLQPGKCVQTATIQGPCHVCVCAEGVYHCRGEPCTQVAASITIASRNIDLPDIKEGDPCIPGKSYKIECNRCHCTNAKTLMCSKMACLDWLTSPKKELRQEVPSQVEKKPTKTESKPRVSRLPLVPAGRCKPGRIYRKECTRCFCNIKGQALCSENKNGACAQADGQIRPALYPVDVRPPFTRMELKGVLELPDAASKCDPGKTYKVECNNCVCNEHYNLMCTKRLCLSFGDINRLEAEDKSGKECDGTKTTNFECIECKCVKGKTVCKDKSKCVSEVVRAKLSSGSNNDLKLHIDPEQDKCVPNGVYTDNCNKCYCQPDGSLRCSLKTCLNYVQSKALDAQFERLKKEGL